MIINRLRSDPSDPSSDTESGSNDGADDVTSRPITKIEKAVIILENILSDGPVPVNEIHDLMEEDGIGSKTAQRAKTRIGAVQEYIDGTPVWTLPS